jgi:hypothetical protein
MFRKVALALVAASVLTVPVLAQDATPGAGKVSPTAPASAPPVKAVKADKVVTKHHMVNRHHRDGTKVVKHPKHGTHAYHMKHGRTATKQVSGKPIPVNQVSTKPAAKSGVN